MRALVVLVCLTGAILAAPLVTFRGAGQTEQATLIGETPEAGPARLGGDLPGNPQIHLVEVTSGFDRPVNVAFPPDGSGRVFVVEQVGTIRVVNPDGSVEPEPFLDVSASIGQHQGE
jgi:hypothetical protein